MNKKENSKSKFGLIGKNISYSFSPDYFNTKFKKENVYAEYQTFDIQDIYEVSNIFSVPNLHGLNVTIPYKESIIPFLDKLSETAQEIGAVNTIAFRNNQTIGFNTDFLGFKKSLEPLLQAHHTQALILGTGGANKAVKFALKQLGIAFKTVSRNVENGDFVYENLDADIMQEHPIIINATPLGTFPNVENHPNIPVEALDERHLVYDLIYNPAKTQLLQLAENQGAQIKNGLEMLEIQAEEAWKIWNEK